MGRVVGGNESCFNSGGAGSENVTLSYVYIHDTGSASFFTRNCNNWVVEYGWFAKNESTSVDHSEGWAAWDTDNVTVRYNVWEDIEGTGVLVIWGDGWEIYGNVVYYIDGKGTGHGAFAGWDPGVESYRPAHNIKIYNNTVVGYGPGNFSSNSTNIYAYNNIYYINTTGGLYAVTHDYNLFINQTLANSEANSQMWFGGSEIFLDYVGHNYRLTQATLPGTILDNLYGKDMDGYLRGADGTWDRGAHEFSESSITAPESPSNLRIK